jgi:hypothetical protein
VVGEDFAEGQLGGERLGLHLVEASLSHLEPRAVQLAGPSRPRLPPARVGREMNKQRYPYQKDTCRYLFDLYRYRM